jgi:hypothetical protein
MHLSKWRMLAIMTIVIAAMVVSCKDDEEKEDDAADAGDTGTGGGGGTDVGTGAEAVDTWTPTWEVDSAIDTGANQGTENDTSVANDFFPIVYTFDTDMEGWASADFVHNAEEGTLELIMDFDVEGCVFAEIGLGNTNWQGATVAEFLLRATEYQSGGFMLYIQSGMGWYGEWFSFEAATDWTAAPLDLTYTKDANAPSDAPASVELSAVVALGVQACTGAGAPLPQRISVAVDSVTVWGPGGPSEDVDTTASDVATDTGGEVEADAGGEVDAGSAPLMDAGPVDSGI